MFTTKECRPNSCLCTCICLFAPAAHCGCAVSGVGLVRAPQPADRVGRCNDRDRHGGAATCAAADSSHTAADGAAVPTLATAGTERTGGWYRACPLCVPCLGKWLVPFMLSAVPIMEALTALAVVLYHFQAYTNLNLSCHVQLLLLCHLLSPSQPFC